MFLSNDEHVHEMIASLKAIGLKLALDDFGTGYSSLSYLQRVPFDKIKIDRSFVTGASDPEGRNAALIRAMVGLASDLKMQTTAEGVETQEELQLVRDARLLAGPGLYLRQADASRRSARARHEGRGDRAERNIRRASRACGSSAQRCFTTRAR